MPHLADDAYHRNFAQYVKVSSKASQSMRVHCHVTQYSVLAVAPTVRRG
jgi:hypothetical protein